VIVYMYAGAWLLTTTRRYWTNVSRRCGQAGATEHAGESSLSGPVTRHGPVNFTYSTSVLTRHGQDFATFNATRPLFTC
jgi:hypothetical protein